MKNSDSRFIKRKTIIGTVFVIFNPTVFTSYILLKPYFIESTFLPSVEFNSISLEEFNEIPEASKHPDLSLVDVRKIEVIVTVNNPKGSQNVDIKLPNLIEAIDEPNNIRTLHAGYRSLVYNEEENTKYQTAFIMFDARGLTQSLTLFFHFN